jgi:Mn2+/Fe2+ NRAMP family transporter
MSISRFLSLIVFGLYLIGLFFRLQSGEFARSFEGVILVLVFLVFNAFCLACIWFPDKMGGRLVMSKITRTSPGCFVAFMGWVVFLSPVLRFIFTKIIYK